MLVSEAVVNVYPRVYPDLRAREGTLVQGPGTPVYIIESYAPGHKRQIISPEGFAYYGLSVAAVKGWPAARVNSYTTTAHVHPVKSLFVDLWYTYPPAYNTYFDRSFFSGIPPSTWNGPISYAVVSWDATPTPYSLYELNWNPGSQIHVSVNYQTFEEAGMAVLRSALQGPSCGDPPDCPGP
jgi:hypothetical protein